MSVDQDLHDLLADLSAQSYFVARELDPEHAIAVWGELAHAVVDSCDLEGYQDFDGCPYTKAVAKTAAV